MDRRTFRFLFAGIVGIAISSAYHGDETPETELQRLVRPFSTQQFVLLNVDESFAFKLNNGDTRVIRLVSVQEHKDNVVKLMRRAEVRVEIDGKPLDLVSMPYVMPTETAGLRLQADTTSGYGNISKQVQLSLWDADDPIVDTKRFAFPIKNYRILSHGTQAYNEPVHLGAGDDDPAGQLFCHDYGFDQGGFEGGETVLSPVQGKIVLFWPSREDLCSAVVQDRSGLNWELCHLFSVESNIIMGAHVEKGQKIGMLGKSGPSGNFSHLHLGTYLNMHDLEIDNRNRRLNFYPWLVAAYQAQHPKGILAVARPHHIVLTGEKVVLDGSNSLAWGGNKIVEWHWILPNGTAIKKSKAETSFDRPGAYVATLWVKDDQGNEDADFCPVKVYTKEKPEKGIPHIYMTCTPTEDIRPNQPVRFRFWFQGAGGGPIQVSFDDGTKMEDYKQYSEFSHAFKKRGVHIVTAQCEDSGKPISGKLKVIVTAAK